MPVEIKYQMLELILRVFCGVLFLFQGYDKLFRIGLKGVKEAMYVESDRKRVPHLFVDLLVYYTTFVEVVAGLLLILGLFQTQAEFLLGIDLILVAVAFSFVEPMWDMKHVFPRLILISILMAMPSEWSFFNLKTILDYLNK